ncbi:diguanylate cyclase domain-containing protein [Pleomorphomonas sp. PLEO]|uniref:sensor domain-containing diguanylate cyclase n=1 Tax=Pleomorphomonas sp. PLEO TaxID=3239306 RepID=UPI00351E6F13
MRIRLIVLAVISLCLAPFLVAQIFAAHKERADALARVEQNVKLSVERVQELLKDTQADIENIAQNISISNAYADTSPETCHDRLSKIARLYENVSHISILTAQEIVYCSSLSGVSGVQADHSGDFIRSMHGNDTLWGETRISRISNTLVVPSATAIRNGVDVDYFVVASVAAQTMLRKALALLDVSLTEAALIDNQGVVLASEHFSSPKTAIGTDLIRRSLAVSSGVISDTTSADGWYYAGVVKLPMNNSRIVFIAPLKSEYDRAKRNLSQAIISAIIETLILASLVMFSVEFLFIRNLRRIGALATEITEGQQGRRISIKSHIPDFKALVSALNLMVDKLEDTSRQDALTGIANRRALDSHMALCDQLLSDGKGPIAVAMIDIDNFKLFNDRFGHASGDKALQRVGLALRKFARRQDEIAARYGGEEFTLVLNDSDPDRLRSHLDAARRAVEDLDIPHPDSPHGRVTVSIGYAFALPGTAMQQAIERADEALYRSKAAGRNRISGEGTL